ncbi:hypothetical protein [Kitasatospora sp. NPDC085879]|uniref:hypothetical protein n=1 Tax=Kitasatospora sp. NPDC085879 TaxID=3154769 RepID=UPI000BB0E5D1|nr:hypothetical protein [Streptomyces sp. TLI_235]PBC69985.1 hypothetical protein BX265_7367 [Streptomyces sp. TLI_235]
MLFLPPALALAAGWAPLRLRPRLEPVPARGWFLLACYLTAPLSAIPRWRCTRHRAVVHRRRGPCVLAGLVVLFVADSRRTKNGTDPNPATR